MRTLVSIPSAELCLQTFCTFPREFSSFLRHGLQRTSTLIPDTVLPIYSRDVRSSVNPASPPDVVGP